MACPAALLIFYGRRSVEEWAFALRSRAGVRQIQRDLDAECFRVMHSAAPVSCRVSVLVSGSLACQSKTLWKPLRLLSPVSIGDTDGPLTTSERAASHVDEGNSLVVAERTEKLSVFKWLSLKLFLPGRGS